MNSWNGRTVFVTGCTGFLGSDVGRAFSAPAINRPLQEAIRPTKDLPGLAGTFRLSKEGYGTVGSRRLVCLTDGSTAVEEVLLTQSDANSRLFRYVVWNYSSLDKRDVDYAVGEIVSTQRVPGSTHVTWTYRYALKSGLCPKRRKQFRKTFLEKKLADWMRSQLERGRTFAEAQP